MPAISNLEKARKKINEEATKIPEGKYTVGVATNLLTAAVKEFNLGEDKANELKSFKFDRALDKQADETEEEPKDLTLEEVVEAQAAQIQNLTNALGKIATLTGYGNHLKEFQIDKWMPDKKDMNKKYG